MSTGALNHQQSLQRLIRHCRRQLMAHAIVRGITTIVAVAVAALLISASLDFVLGLSTWLRTAVLGASIIATLYVAWRHLLTPLLSPMSNETVGAAMDISSPELNQSIATLVSLQNPNVGGNEAGADFMRAELQERVSDSLKTIDLPPIVNLQTTGKRVGAAVVLIVLVLLPATLWPAVSELLLQRFLQPHGNFATATDLYFDVVNGNRIAGYGSTVRIDAVPRWRGQQTGQRPETAELLLTATSGKQESVAMVYDEVAGHFRAEISQVQQPLHYQITSGRTRSELFTIDVVDIPEIQTALLTAVPPAYTARPEQRFDGIIDQMDIFHESQIRIELEFSKPVTSATLVWKSRQTAPETDTLRRTFDPLTGEEQFSQGPGATDFHPLNTNQTPHDPEDLNPDSEVSPFTPPAPGRVALSLSDDGLHGVLDMSAQTGGDFVFEVVDEFQLTNAAEPDRIINVIYDQPPSLKVSGIRNDDRFRPNDVLPVDCHVVDDVGLEDLELHYRVNEEKIETVRAPPHASVMRIRNHSFRLELTKLHVGDGDTIQLCVRATDTLKRPQSRATWSEVLTVHVDPDARPPGARAMEREAEAIIESLEQLNAQVRDDSDAAATLKQQASETWTNKSRGMAQRLSEKQQRQGQQLQQIADVVATHPLMRQVAADLQMLSQKMRREIPQSLASALRADREDVETHLEGAREQIEKVRQQLRAQVQEIAERAELEQSLAQFNRLALDAEQLAGNAALLEHDHRQSANRNNSPTLNQQQEFERRRRGLDRQREDLTGDLEKLLEQERELLHAAQQAQRTRLRSFAERTKALAEKQRQVAQGASDEAMSAADRGKPLADQLDQFHDALATQPESSSEEASRSRTQIAEQLKAAADALRNGNWGAAGTLISNAVKDTDHLPSGVFSEDQSVATLHSIQLSMQKVVTDDTTHISPYQATQKSIVSGTEQLPAELEQLVQRLKLEFLEMTQESQLTQARLPSAADVQRSAGQTLQQLNTHDLQHAATTGRATADALAHIAGVAASVGRKRPSEDSRIPEEIGDRVTDALAGPGRCRSQDTASGRWRLRFPIGAEGSKCG